MTLSTGQTEINNNLDPKSERRITFDAEGRRTHTDQHGHRWTLIRGRWVSEAELEGGER